MNNFRRIFHDNRLEFIVAGAAVLLAVVVQVAVVLPEARRNREARDVLRALDAQIEQSSIVVNDMTTLIETDSTGNDVYDRPDDAILPDLLDAIAQQGRRHNVEILSMKPDKFERTVIPAQGPLQTDAESTRLVVRVTVRSRYRNLGEHLRSLENIPILIAVRDLKVFRVSGKSPTVRATFQIETWTVKTRDA